MKYYVKHSTSLNASSPLDGQEIPCILMNPVFIIIIYDRPPFVPIMSQTNPVHFIRSTLFKAYLILYPICVQVFQVFSFIYLPFHSFIYLHFLPHLQKLYAFLFSPIVPPKNYAFLFSPIVPPQKTRHFSSPHSTPKKLRISLLPIAPPKNIHFSSPYSTLPENYAFLFCLMAPPKTTHFSSPPSATSH